MQFLHRKHDQLQLKLLGTRTVVSDSPDSSVVQLVPGWVVAMSSPRWTVVFFLLSAVAALAVNYQVMTPTALMAAPFVLLVINVGAAIVTHRRFRADLPLLLFHLALLALVALLGLARLIYMEGTLMLTSGTSFEGQLLTDERGPLHAGRLADVHFANEGFSEDISARNRLHATYNRVRWRDQVGQWHAAQIGDDRPLIINGYKIFTTIHRGFSPVFRWQPAEGPEDYGTVQLADPTTGTFAPAMKSKLPNGADIWVMLDFRESAEASPRLREDMGSKALAHTLVLRMGADRYELRLGDHLDLPGGRLDYVRLDSWMGYNLTYDPTRPWIIATVLIGIASLVWVYWRRLWSPVPAEPATP